MAVIKKNTHRVNTGSSNYHFWAPFFLMSSGPDFYPMISVGQSTAPGQCWSCVRFIKERKKTQAESQRGKKGNNMLQQPPSQAEPNERSSALVIICRWFQGGGGCVPGTGEECKTTTSCTCTHTHTCPFTPSLLLPSFLSRSGHFFRNLPINSTCTMNLPFHPFLIHLFFFLLLLLPVAT